MDIVTSIKTKKNGEINVVNLNILSKVISTVGPRPAKAGVSGVAIYYNKTILKI